MRNNDFMRAVPERVRVFCPSELRKFKARSRPWLAQIYFHESSIHYEVWSLGQRLSIHPQGSLEIGLHFESRNRALNQSLLDGFVRYLVEVKDELGPEWEAEKWDKAWAKVYKTIPRMAFDENYLDEVADELARCIAALQPILQCMYP